MHIQWKICYRAQGINHKWSNRYIWNKTTIHDINMNPVATCHLHCFYLDTSWGQTLAPMKDQAKPKNILLEESIKTVLMKSNRQNTQREVSVEE